MLSTESLSILSPIALTGQDDSMSFSLQQVILFILANDLLILSLFVGGLVGAFLALYPAKEDDN
jgi:hypothetical protein